MYVCMCVCMYVCIDHALGMLWAGLGMLQLMLRGVGEANKHSRREMLSNRQTDRPNYRNPRCACVLRVNA